MDITVEPVRVEDAEAIVAAEDEEIVRWLSGGRSTIEGTRDYVRALARRAEAGSTKRGFVIRVDGACVGTCDVDADPQEGIGSGDVNISYALAPRLRGQGVTARAVALLCDVISDRGVGQRAVIRCDVRNRASARVAEKAGFTLDHEFDSATETGEQGRPVRLRVYVRLL